MSGLSTGSAVGALVADACAGLLPSCAVVSFGEVGGTGVVGRKKTQHRSVNTGAGSSSRRGRNGFPTAMGHAFTRPLHLLYLHDAGLHMMWYVRTPVDRYCVAPHVSARITVSW